MTRSRRFFGSQVLVFVAVLGGGGESQFSSVWTKSSRRKNRG
jgi:hypothetical protein